MARSPYTPGRTRNERLRDQRNDSLLKETRQLHEASGEVEDLLIDLIREVRRSNQLALSVHPLLTEEERKDALYAAMPEVFGKRADVVH